MYLWLYTLTINRNFTNWFPNIVLPIRTTRDVLVFDIDTLFYSICHFSIKL